MELISEGAEGKLFKIEENILRKIREPKPYRLEIIDKKIRKFRTKREFKVLTKLYENKVNVPKPIELNQKEFYFDFEFIVGENLKDTINKELLFKIFDEIIKMHNLNITHSDLTTLNILTKDNECYLIDFGLAEFTFKSENKAVDLNLFFQCLKNEHPVFFKYKKELIEIYLKKAENSQKTIESLKNIEKRGRNK